MTGGRRRARKTYFFRQISTPPSIKIENLGVISAKKMSLSPCAGASSELHKDSDNQDVGFDTRTIARVVKRIAPRERGPAMPQ